MRMLGVLRPEKTLRGALTATVYVRLGNTDTKLENLSPSTLAAYAAAERGGHWSYGPDLIELGAAVADRINLAGKKQGALLASLAVR